HPSATCPAVAWRDPHAARCSATADFGILFRNASSSPLRSMKTPIRRKIKGTIGRFAATSRLLEHRFRSKMVIVTFHRVSDAVPEGGLVHSSSKFEDYCEFFRQHFKVVPLSEQ